MVEINRTNARLISKLGVSYSNKDNRIRIRQNTLSRSGEIERRLISDNFHKMNNVSDYCQVSLR